jgi:hypothetical protein
MHKLPLLYLKNCDSGVSDGIYAINLGGLQGSLNGGGSGGGSPPVKRDSLVFCQCRASGKVAGYI